MYVFIALFLVYSYIDFTLFLVYYIVTVKEPKTDREERMRWPKEFERVSGQKVKLIGTKIYIYQWNAGKKNFMVEHVGLSVHQQNTWTIPGKGDEAMKAAIEKAKSLI